MEVAGNNIDKGKCVGFMKSNGKLERESVDFLGVMDN